MADDYTTKKKKMVAEAERQNAGKSFLDNERSMGRIPVGVSPEVEGGPKAGMTMMSVPDEPRAPRAVVRGNADEMTAEYYAPRKVKSPVDESSSVSGEAARAAVSRLKKAMAEMQMSDDNRLFYGIQGSGVGAAVAGGLGGPLAPLTLPFGAGAGLVAGSAAHDMTSNRSEVLNESAKAKRAIREALQSGAFTKEELDAATAEGGVSFNY